MFETKAKSSPAVCEYENINAQVALKCAEEGIVLLKNNGILPLKRKSSTKSNPIALYGTGAVVTLRGGTGSAEVNARPHKNIDQALEEAGFVLSTKKWLEDYRQLYEKSRMDFRHSMRKKSRVFNLAMLTSDFQAHFDLPEGIKIDSHYFSPTAAEDNCIYVISRQAGESNDRKVEKGDFLLTDTEVENLRICSTHYKNLILVINAGGYVDLTPLSNLPIGAILFMGQAGAKGSEALVNIITGKVSPSGRLSATWPENYQQVPFANEFATDQLNVPYKENIYLGYRYYDSFGKTPRFPFGFGLGYGEFKSSYKVQVKDEIITVSATVKNNGKIASKEVVQIYASCPQGRLEKEAQRLVAFEKTKTIASGKEETLVFEINFSSLASFDEASNTFILEKGSYILRGGSSSRDTVEIASLDLDDEVAVKKVRPLSVPKINGKLKHPTPMESTGKKKPKSIKVSAKNLYKKENLVSDKIHPQPHFNAKADKALNSLKPRELVNFCMGDGMDIALPAKRKFIVPGAAGYTSRKFESKGIPSVSFCDGPSGLRLFEESIKYGSSVRMTKPVLSTFEFYPLLVRKILIKKARPKSGKMLYQYATAFPVGICMAQTWNRKLCQEFGKAVNLEMDVFGVKYWLAPGMNLIRNPLCGRNFEYYSEDPVLSGNIASAVIQGVQSEGQAKCTIKHFLGNNQETNRQQVNSMISERALRELYLENFRIAVECGKPKALMASYNKVNGHYAAENHDLLTKVLKEEWGFSGLVMTDWVTQRKMYSAVNCLNAGVNLLMPGIPYNKFELYRELLKNENFEFQLKQNAGKVLGCILD